MWGTKFPRVDAGTLKNNYCCFKKSSDGHSSDRHTDNPIAVSATWNT